MIPAAQPEADALAFVFAGGRILVLPGPEVPAFERGGKVALLDRDGLATVLAEHFVESKT